MTENDSKVQVEAEADEGRGLKGAIGTRLGYRVRGRK